MNSAKIGICSIRLFHSIVKDDVVTHFFCDNTKARNHIGSLVLTYVGNMTYILFVYIVTTLGNLPTNFGDFFYFCQFSNQNLKICPEWLSLS